MKKLVVNLYFKINEIIAASCLSTPFQFDSPGKNSEYWKQVEGSFKNPFHIVMFFFNIHFFYFFNQDGI